ncbi:MAG: CoA transferase, partial [Chloroflexota bacterium]|nr:CoA transferase [Chloroflexota bacterium]
IQTSPSRIETSPSGGGAAQRRRGPAAYHAAALYNTTPPPPRRPLDGVRVLDFTWAIAGSLGTRLLADLGAEVLKIESESRIDPIRYRGVQPPDRFSINTNGTFNDCAGGKKSVTLNLKTEEGIEAVRELAKQADLVTSNYTPYRLDRWGIGYDDLRQIKPDIIVCNVAVMGIEGPRAEWRSYGNGIVAMCGLAHRSGFPGKAPIGLGTLHTDFTVPYYLATSVMAALDHRERTGEGRYLEIAQYETAVQLLDTELIEALNGGRERPRMGNRSPFMSPHGVFPAAGEERWVAIACRDDTDWRNLCRVISRADLASRPELDSLAGRRAHEDELEAAIADWTQTQDDWTSYRLLINAGVPASPVERLEDFFDGQDRAMRDNYNPAVSPEGCTFQIQQEPILWDSERLPAVRAPIWSEHTEEVLKTLLNYTDADMTRLAAAGTLG